MDIQFPASLRRHGLVLLVLGAVDAGIIASPAIGDTFAAVVSALVAFGLGLALLRARPRVVLWAGTGAAFLLAAAGAAVLGAAVVWPVDLIWTMVQLDPSPFVWPAALAVLNAFVLAWTLRTLHASPVWDVIAASGIRFWAFSLPSKACAGVLCLAAFLVWMALHGASATLAASLALQQMGPGYRYQLTWISRETEGPMKVVTGVVTAWNKREIKKIILHWREK